MPPLAQREQLGDDAEVVLGHVDREALHRLVQLAVHLAGDDLGLADGELEALAPHHLDEHRELELASALHLPRVGTLGRQHAERHVADELGVEAALHQAGGELRALLAGERRRVDADRHRQARLVDVITGSGRGSSGSASVSPIVTSASPAMAMMSPGPASSAATRSSAVGDVQLGDLGPLDRAVDAAPRDLLALAHAPVRTRHSASRPT